MSQRTSQISIRGMSCANCSGTIEDRVGELSGVSSVDANYATDEGSVTYDPEQVSLADVVDAVHDAGYGVDTETTTGSSRTVAGTTTLPTPQEPDLSARFRNPKLLRMALENTVFRLVPRISKPSPEATFSSRSTRIAVQASPKMK